MRGRYLRHPSTARLRAWLDTGEPLSLGEHVEHCERCAERLERVDREYEPLSLDGTGALRRALSELVSPPSDLSTRVLVGVEQRRRTERELSLLAGLFSIGVETAQLMIDAAPPADLADDRDTDEDDHEREEMT